MTEKIRILLLSANPWTTGRILVDEEAREIFERIQEGPYRDRFELHNHTATRAIDLQRLLLLHKPHIVHFSGHGSRKHKIILCGGPGRGKAIDQQGLAEVLGLYSHHLRLVLLNACFSKTQARAIAKVIDYSIGTGKGLGDKGGVTFAGAFYRALGFGKTIREAFSSAKAELALTKVRRTQEIELFVRKGINEDDPFPQHSNHLIGLRSDSSKLSWVDLFTDESSLVLSNADLIDSVSIGLLLFVSRSIRIVKGAPQMTYKVKPGDNLSKIAKRYGISLAQLLQANPQITNPDRIQVGQVVNLPDTSTETTQPLPANVVPAIQPTPTPTPTATGAATAVGALGQAIAETLLGALSAKYETGGRGPGTVSTGKGDPGGVSYGSYQMASKMGVPQKFVAQAGFPWLTDFQNLTAGSAEFTACWKRIATSDADAFQKCQHEYIKQTHYDLLVAKVLSDDQLDVNTRSRALQDVVWSTAVQHGGNTSMVHKALANVSCARTDAAFDEQLIRAIYAERGRKKADGNLAYFSKSSPNVQKGVANRFQNELNDALAMLAKETKATY